MSDTNGAEPSSYPLHDTHEVDQTDDGAMIDTSTFHATAPLPATANTLIYKHLDDVGYELDDPVACKAIISPGKGVLVLADHLKPFLRNTDPVGENNSGMEIVFPAPADGGEARRFVVLGSMMAEFSILDARVPTSFVLMRVRALIVDAEGFDSAGTGSGDDRVGIWIGCDDSPDNVFREVPNTHGAWEVVCDDDFIVPF